MKSTAKKKPVEKPIEKPVVVPPPTLEQRVNDLMQELDLALDALALERQGPGHQAINAVGEPELVRLPIPSIRRLIDAKGFGDCRCRSYLEATKVKQ